MQFFTLGNSKIEVLETYFFDILPNHNGHTSHVKHILSNVYVFFTLFRHGVRGRGSSPGIGTQRADASFPPRQLENGILGNLFVGIVVNHNDHTSYVKHVLGDVYVVFSLFRDWLFGRGVPKDW